MGKSFGAMPAAHARHRSEAAQSSNSRWLPEHWKVQIHVGLGGNLAKEVRHLVLELKEFHQLQLNVIF